MIKDLTYKKDQLQFVADELEAMKRPRLNLQPIFYGTELKFWTQEQLRAVPANHLPAKTFVCPAEAPRCAAPLVMKTSAEPFIKVEDL